MRDRRETRAISPKYGHSRRHNRVVLSEYTDHCDDATWQHIPISRQPLHSLSPPLRNRLRQPPDTSAIMPRQLDRGERVDQVYLSQLQSRSGHSPPLQHCNHDLDVSKYIDLVRPSKLSPEIKHYPHNELDPQPMVTRKPLFFDYGPGRSHLTTLKQDSMLTGGTHNMEFLQYRPHVRDPQYEEDIVRGTKRAKVLHHQRDVPHSGTIEPSHPRLIEGGSSSYQHDGSYRERHHVPPGNISRVTLSPSKHQVGDQCNDLDYCMADGTAHSSRNAREGRVSIDPVHHSRHRDSGHPPRSLLRSTVQRDGYELDIGRAMENPIFSDRGKGLCNVVYSPSRDGYVDEMELELSHRPMRAKHRICCAHNCDDISNDADTDSDSDSGADANPDSDAECEIYDHGYNQRRVPVKDRLSLPSPIMLDENENDSYPVKERISRAVTFEEPNLMHSWYYDPNTTNSVKKRVRPGPYELTKKNFRVKKFQKRGWEDKPKYKNTKGSDEVATDTGSPVKRDPPEGSEEYKRQVEKAFLKYVRVINDSAWEKKKFLQNGILYCYVCGRKSSEEFASTHDLVVHAFWAKNPGKKTAHRGFQKALCLHMGWNWCVTPDQSKLYQAGPADEAEALKKDLILWPPIVVIRNSSVDSKASNKSKKSVSIEAIDCMLRGLLGDGKAKLSLGKPSNQGVILVEFPPMLSGFISAEKLHNHFSKSNCGKEHLELFIKSRSDAASDDQNVKENENEVVLYGYLAGIDDLDKLNSDTKKIYLRREDILKSRKELLSAAI